MALCRHLSLQPALPRSADFLGFLLHKVLELKAESAH